GSDESIPRGSSRQFRVRHRSGFWRSLPKIPSASQTTSPDQKAHYPASTAVHQPAPSSFALERAARRVCPSRPLETARPDLETILSLQAILASKGTRDYQSWSSSGAATERSSRQ